MAGMVSAAPRRSLFIASIGNPRPYRSTRHSAGHVVLDAILPVLPSRLSAPQAVMTAPVAYKTWHSPSYMNESGPKLVRQLQNWISTTQTDIAKNHRAIPTLTTTSNSNTATDGAVGPLNPVFSPTLVILHDELEAPLGKIRVKRGGAEQASLRGHRGLISAMESLRGKGLYPPSRTGEKNQGVKGGGDAGNNAAALSVMRIGIGIGRPTTRGRNDVADYVLTEMNSTELNAMRAAVDPVLDLLVEEAFRGADQA